MDPYVSTSKKAQFAAECAARLKADGCELHPAVAHGKKIANSFWGYSWCRNLENWQDYESRLPAGRSLLRAGAVIDLAIEPNLVTAFVADGELYQVRIPMEEPDEEQLAVLRSRCAGNIHSLMDLIQGNLSEELLHLFCDPETGIFPQSHQVKFICNCIDDSCLCRHAAAVLYGIGARLDDDPSLFFRLRGMDAKDFFDADAAAETLPESAEWDSAELSDMFGIDIQN